MTANRVTQSSKVPLLAGLLFILATLIITYFVAKNIAQEKLQQRVSNQLLQVVNELKITLERHSYLPALLSSSSEVIQFMHNQNSQDEVFKQQQLAMNLSLEHTNNISESSVIYIMRPDGTTLATSNWESDHSFMGNNFSFRPYFQLALQNVLGRYYAVGTITGERGYFFASSILDKDRVLGVLAVKVAIDDIEFTWGRGDVDFMVTDPDGVIFLSSQEDWNLKTLQPLSGPQKEKLIASRRYGKSPLKPLQNTLLDPDIEHFQRIKLLGKDYEMLSKKMDIANWDVRILANHDSIKKTIASSLLISALIALLITALAILLWKTQQQRKQYQEQVREELEQKVLERTQALKQSQEDLIQAAKMAALGQLSAGITHEINNPLTAIRAYADNARQFLQKGRFDMVASNLEEISKLTDSMAAITRQLKSFSRKSQGQTKAVALNQAIKNALSIVNPKITSQNVTCHLDPAVENNTIKIQADEIWLSQILVNLLTNAIAATSEQSQRDIWISIRQHPENKQVCVEIRDNGKGIEENNLPHIFEPFFTTKASSKGLGLGLSISFNLAKDMHGSLTARNITKGGPNGRQVHGALFTLCLPQAD